MSFGNNAPLRRFAAVLVAGLALLTAPPAQAGPAATAPAATRPAQAWQTYQQWVSALADEAMEGRGPGTGGLVKARDYLLGQFKSMGLSPAFGSTFLQPFEMTIGMKCQRQELSIVGSGGDVLAEARPGKDFNALGFSASGAFDGQAVFVGYGIVAPERGYDSYAAAGGESLWGKVAVAFRYEPQDAAGRSRWAKGAPWTNLAGLSGKARWAAEHGAAALLVVNPPSHAAGETLRTTRETGFTMPERIPAMHVRLALFRRMLRSAGEDPDAALRQLQLRADRGDGGPQALAGVFLRGRVELKRERGVAHNVAAVLPGAGRLADQVVVIGAHYDHLGYGGPGSRFRGRAVHPGADDNASGTAGVLMLAAWFSQRLAAGSAPAGRRALVFAAFAGEERGLIGSRHMAGRLGELAVPDARAVAMINLDMIGRLRGDEFHIWGVGSGDRWGEIVDRAAEACPLSVRTGQSALMGSDHLSFYRRGVPVLSVCTGSNPDMHTPRDTAEKINAPGAVGVLGVVDAIVTELWTTPQPPAYKASRWFGRSAGGAYLGVRADPASVGGCKLLEVRPGTPAGKAGLRPGDVIVAWNGRPVADLQALLAQVQAAEPSEAVKLTVRRGGKDLAITVKLARR